MKKVSKYIFPIICAVWILVAVASELNDIFIYYSEVRPGCRRAEEAAISYIEKTYPDFLISEIKTEYDDEPGIFVVECIDANGYVRNLNIGQDGSVKFDEYLRNKAEEMISQHTDVIEKCIEKMLYEKAFHEVHSVRINDLCIFGVDFTAEEIVFEGYDVTDDPLGCSIRLSENDDITKEEFCKKIPVMHELIMNMGYHIIRIAYVQHDTPQSRFVLEYPMGIDDVTYEMLLELTHEVK